MCTSRDNTSGGPPVDYVKETFRPKICVSLIPSKKPVTEKTETKFNLLFQFLHQKKSFGT